MDDNHEADGRRPTSSEAAGALAHAENELALAKARVDALESSLRKATRSAQLGADVAKALTGIEPLSDLLGACAAAIVRHLDAALARIWILNDDGSTLYLQASAGLSSEVGGKHARVPVASSRIGQVTRERRPYLTNDLGSDAGASDPEWVVREGLSAFAAYPLFAQERSLGVIALFRREPFPVDVLDAIASVADIMALGMEHRREATARADAELRKASILEASMDAVVVLDRAGCIVDWNRAAEEQLLYPRAAVLGKEMAELIIPPALRERHRRGLAQYLATGKGANLGKRVEMIARRADGSEFPIELSITPMNVGGTLEFTGYLRDITDRRRAESGRAELLASEQRARSALATTLRSIGDAVIATDLETLVTFMNPVAEGLTGWSLEEARGQPLGKVFRIVDAGTRREVERPADRVLKEGSIAGLANHTLLVTRNGSEIPIDDSGAPIRDDAGRMTGVVLVFRDTSAQQLAADRSEFLAEATPALASVLDVHKTLSTLARLAVPKLADWCAVDMLRPDGSLEQIAVAHTDPAKVILAETFRSRYPLPPDAPYGVGHVIRTGVPELHGEVTDEQLAASTTDPEHLARLRELGLRSVMTVPLLVRGKPLGAITLVFADSDRRYSATDLRFAEEFARRAAIAVDNAKLFESEQEARASAETASRGKDEFLATVSHELRTPLNAMLGWTRLLRRGDLPPEKRERALETIERNAVTQTQLIEDLLDVSRIISGNLRLDVQPVDLPRVVQQALDALQLAAQAKSIQLVTRVDPHTAPIQGDPHRLQQVVWNLLSNAIKFTPTGGRIDLMITCVHGTLTLAVTDNGRGIEPEFLLHAFERFKQANATTTRVHGGLGLGLAICRHIVELHGGVIEAASEGLGRGATFTVKLPVSLTHTPARAVGAERRGEVDMFGPQPELVDLRILVVDDEPDARELLAEILTRCGSIVSLAGGAAEAMIRLRLDKPQVLISDIGLPGEDGYSLIRRIRALPASDGGEIPAAALSAYARAEDRRRVLDAGFTMHMSKPMEPAEVVAAVASLTRFGSRR